MTIVLVTIAGVLYAIALWIRLWTARNFSGPAVLVLGRKRKNGQPIMLRPDLTLVTVASLILIASWSPHSWIGVLCLAALCINNALDGFADREHSKRYVTPKQARVMLYKLIAWATLGLALMVAMFLAP